MASSDTGSSLRNSFPENELYIPKVDDPKFKGTPDLYLFRIIADKIGAISMAQGSPLYGPPDEVEQRVHDMREEAYSANERGFPTDLNGYPAYKMREVARIRGIDFLAGPMQLNVNEHTDNYLVMPGGYARTVLRNLIAAFADPKTGLRQNDCVITSPGCWPLIYDIAESLLGIRTQSTENISLKFEDYRKIIEASPEKGRFMFYFCDPNNPLDHKYSDEEIAQFFRDMHAYKQQNPDIEMLIIADNPYWGWCNPEYLEENGFPSFARVADHLYRTEKLDVRPLFAEIFSMSKAMGLASRGGSLLLHSEPELVAKVHANQVKYDGLPTYDQATYLAKSLEYALENPDYIIERSAQIHEHLKDTHRLVKERFPEGSQMNVLSTDVHGAYVAFELDPSLFGKTVELNGKAFTINTVRDVCIYLLEHEDFGVGLTPIDERDNLPNSIRMFVDLDDNKLYEGVARFIAGMERLAQISNDPYYDVRDDIANGAKLKSRGAADGSTEGFDYRK